MNRPPDFIAELHYRTTEQGGRKTPAFSGYRPQIKFAFSEMQTSGQQKFLEKGIAYPGDTILAEITVVSPQFFKHQLEKDTVFEFREGARIIGTGKILEVFNEELLSI